jgi:hypothetical protein
VNELLQKWQIGATISDGRKILAANSFHADASTLWFPGEKCDEAPNAVKMVTKIGVHTDGEAFGKC